MLAATREPSHHHGATPASAASPGFARLMSVLQVAGALLAIPVGLASAYSIYHANFSVEARCQGLRANIVAMLDKSIDASTLRMLVGRDVTSFERTCGAVDPDAVAAFQRLLSTGKPATHALAQAAPAEPQAKPAQPVAEAKAVRHANADVTWVTAVREALVRHHDEAPAEPTETAHVTPPPPAPSVPATRTVASAPATAPVASATPLDHPVPPALIPDAPPMVARAGILSSHLPLTRGTIAR